MTGRNMFFISRIISYSLLILFIFSTCLSAQEQVLTLQELFRLADENSKSIRMHQLAIEEAEQGIKVAQNAYLPSLSVKAEASYIGDGYMTDRDFSNGVHADMPHFGNSFVVKAEQVIYAGGGIKSGVKQNKLQKQASEQTYLDNRQNLRFLLAGYYLDLFQLRNQELVYQKNIEQTRLLVKDMQAAYRQGTALKSDITRYELQLQNLELKRTSTTNKLNVLNHELVTTLGLKEGIRIVPDTAYLQHQLIEERAELGFQVACFRLGRFSEADQLFHFFEFLYGFFVIFFEIFGFDIKHQYDFLTIIIIGDDLIEQHQVDIFEMFLIFCVQL